MAETNQSTSPTSPKRYLVTFYKAPELIISAAMYRKWSEEDASGVMLIDRVKTIRLKERVIRTADISCIDEYRSHEAENQWTPPSSANVNLENLAKLRRMKEAILDNHEPYDPKKHLPPEWR